MKKSIIIGCQGDVIFCEKENIDFISFTMGKIVSEEIRRGVLEMFEHRARVCNISIRGNITTFETELVGNQMIEAQEIFEEIGILSLNVKDFHILKKRISILKEVNEMEKTANFMLKNGINEHNGLTIEELEKKANNFYAEIKNLNLSIDFEVEHNK